VCGGLTPTRSLQRAGAFRTAWSLPPSTLSTSADPAPGSRSPDEDGGLRHDRAVLVSGFVSGPPISWRLPALMSADGHGTKITARQQQRPTHTHERGRVLTVQMRRVQDSYPEGTPVQIPLPPPRHRQPAFVSQPLIPKGFPDERVAARRSRWKPPVSWESVAPPARLERAACGLGIGLRHLGSCRPVTFGLVRMGAHVAPSAQCRPDPCS